MKKDEIKRLNFPDIKMKDLLEKFENRFLLSIAVAKRARQIKEGSRPLVEFVPNEPLNPISIAMKELLEDKIDVEINPKKEEGIAELEEMDLNLSMELEEEKEKEKEKEKEEKASKDAKKKEAKQKSRSLAA